MNGFELRKTNNKIKTEYATNNNYNLLHILYIKRKIFQYILKK